MRILCLQHVPFEGPAALADWARTRGHSLKLHAMFGPEPLPELDAFDGLIVMGGPMNVDQTETYPWLADERVFVRRAIEADKFVVGVCLGAQMIARALGAAVAAGAQKEIGWFPIQRSADCPAWLELPAELRVLHWHGDRFELPPGAQPLAASAACDHQGFILGHRVLGWQCHLEATADSLRALAGACAGELAAGGPTVMDAGALKAEPEATYQTMHTVLFAMLDRMVERGGAWLDVEDWGRTHYAEALQRQKQRVDARRAGRCRDALIFTEHEPVYTMGLRKGAARHLIWSPEDCARRGIEVVQTNRGGDITYHGPGQLVAYPIVSLQRQRDLHAYLRDLEEVVIRTLATYGLEASRREGKTGIWLEQARKICAIGVAVRSWVSYHGFALNLDPDMDHFSGIVPCGITDGAVTSLAHELGRPIDPDQVKSRLSVEFEAVFRNSLHNGFPQT